MEIEALDEVQLLDGTKLHILEDQFKEPFNGYTFNDNNVTEFKITDIDCYSKHFMAPVGGDKTNYWMFYTGPGYKTTKENIANWAKFTIPEFKDMSIDEIIKLHIYFGTDECSHYGIYKAFYNGDTYILYNNINELSPEYKEDALMYREQGNR